MSLGGEADEPERDSDADLFIRLYMDDMVPVWLAAALRTVGFEAHSSHEVGMTGAADEEHLAFAAAGGRVLFTANVSDARHNFAVIHGEWLQAGREHTGILLCPHQDLSRNPAEVLERLEATARQPYRRRDAEPDIVAPLTTRCLRTCSYLNRPPA